MSILKLLSELAHATPKQSQSIIKNKPQNIQDAFAEHNAASIKLSLLNNIKEYFPNERTAVQIKIN